ncbi:hypothetical protein [Dendrosporobacter sp. 1207_IL3150]|uniref:hypothetical protein n=1 Tax=Dendrosporobacter sp. 1207_IL3150 TaxID=3084054 RepID=UPI002FDAAE91
MINKQTFHVAIIFMLMLSVFLGGCSNVNPVDPQPPYSTTPPANQPPQGNDVVVTYNYGDTDKVQLSANNVVLKVGQKLILQPAQGLTKNTRFTSSGENFFGDVMKQEVSDNNSGKAVFTAIKAGKGKLQIIPNTTEVERAVDFWVTVQ